MLAMPMTPTEPDTIDVRRFNREFKGKRVYCDGVDVTKLAYLCNPVQGWVMRFVNDENGKRKLDEQRRPIREKMTGKVEIR